MEEKIKKYAPILIVLFFFDLVLWSRIVLGSGGKFAEYFLPVGEGDSELIVTSSGAKVLIDGGPLGSPVLENLGKILPPYDKYIDVVLLTHPQEDHFGGLIDVLRDYRVGVFISNGSMSAVKSYDSLAGAIDEKKIRAVAVHAGDKIRMGDSAITVLSPEPDAPASSDPNESAIVLEVESQEMKSIFTSDMTAAAEMKVANFIAGPMNVLKVAHHGSRYSSSEKFLAAVLPMVSIIEVGKNSYGHPSPDIVERLKNVGSRVFRTDEEGLLKVFRNGDGQLEVMRLK